MKKIRKYIYLLIVLLIAAINFNLILKPLDLVTGGTQGAALLFSHVFKITPSIVIFIINIIMLIISYLFLERETTYGTIVATFMYPLFVRLTNSLTLNLVNEYNFLFVILAGIVCGVTGGLVYKLGFSNGGISIIALLVRKYLHIEIAITNFIVNGIIVLLGLYYFGIVKCLKAILVIFLQSFLIRLILKRKVTNSKKHIFRKN